jgi:hypothetical protein
METTMSKYRVYLTTGASAVVTVEAETEDEAVDLAFDEVPREVCAQCSGWGRDYGIDLGEWDLDQTEGVVEVDDETDD